MKKYKEVNGRKFEVMKPIDNPRMSYRKVLSDCYDRPSETKESIYWDWEHFCVNAFDDLDNFGIVSYNIFMFTLGWNTSEGQYYVTKTRQEFYPYK